MKTNPIFRVFYFIFIFHTLFVGVAESQKASYSLLKQQGEAYFDQGSFSKAHQVYKKALEFDLDENDKRWIEFRLADTLWRSEASSKKFDTSILDQSKDQLNKMIRDVRRNEDKDRIWAEIQESLGDYWWMRSQTRNWGSAWQHYQKALDWWAGAKDLELARNRYLNIIWNVTTPPWRPSYYSYGYYGNYVPVKVLENVLKISQSPEDQARASYFLAMGLRNQGNLYQQQRIPKLFEKAIQLGKSTEWYDDSIYHYAEWLSGSGEVIILANGQQQRKPNYNKGLKYYRRLISEFEKGETRFYDDAQRQIENITKPTLSISVDKIFLPGSQINYQLSWRNIKQVTLSLYPIDLTKDVKFSKDVNVDRWKDQINLLLKEKITSWIHDTEDKKDYIPGSKTLSLEEKLPVGAYILKASGENVNAREIILVTDAAVVLKNSNNQALVYVCDSANGAPIKNSKVQLQQRFYTGHRWVWRSATAKTNKEGLAKFHLKKTRHNSQIFVAAAHENRQAFVTSYNHRGYIENESWKMYVTTDRPAYRPNEKANWKLTARTYDGSKYSTPSNAYVEYQVSDPRGVKLKEGTLKLNEYGSAWESLQLSESIPLGTYTIVFWTKNKKKHIGSANLFRLEEYKLPEFKVSVNVPEENGKKKTFQLGDTLEADIHAEYYFGGPVANASVEVIVYQKSYQPFWRPAAEYPWYYEDLHSNPHHYWGHGQQVKREVLKTDSQGNAHLTIPTQRGNQDLEYRIEARVTDSSRREIISSESVRVSRQAYFVYMNPKHYLYKPQDKVDIKVNSMDPNNQPISAEGVVKVTRDYWFEIWVDPDGREIQGDELKRLKEKSVIFPPPQPPESGKWKLKFKGYQHDDILTQSVKTDKEGMAEFSFTPGNDGYYRVAWVSQPNEKSIPIKAETTIWAATNATTDLGYRHGGLEIIADKNTFQVGQEVPVMLVAPTNDRYVVFSIEGDDLYDYQLVHMTGTVKLLRLKIQEKHVPNIFLNAVMVTGQQIFSDTEQVIVPPLKNFLNITVESNQDQFQPQEKGTLTITTRNHEDKPVASEVSLALVDEAVFYIQKDLAPDPRQFFFGNKRRHQTKTTSSFQMKRYLRQNQMPSPPSKDYPESLKADGGAFFNENKRMVGKKESSLRSRSMKAKSNAPMESFASMELDDAAMLEEEPGRQSGAGSERANVQVRSDFRSTIIWEPNIKTGKDGKATIKVKFPDSLTQWRATARSVTTKNQFGIQTAKMQTQMPLMVRLQAPRFFVVGDEVTLSAIINNNTNDTLKINPVIEATGLKVDTKSETISIAPNSEKRVDWLAMVPQPGNVKIKVSATNDKFADAMEKEFIAHEHGIEKLIAKSGKLKGKSVNISLDLPQARKKDSAQMMVQVAPSLAITMLDALPYLIDYPYGCTEQTLSRFLPTVITLKTLRDLGLKPEEVANRLFGGINPELANKSHPKGKKNLNKIAEMVEKGLDRLYDFQHSDGGWGWWKKGDSDPFMTAYVLWGLTLAQDAQVEIDPSVLSEAYQFLDKELVEAENQFDQQAWLLHALAFYHKTKKFKKFSKFQSKAFNNLWKHRTKLNSYSRALFTLSAHYFGMKTHAKTLAENLENGVTIDKSPDTSIVQRRPQNSENYTMATAHWGEDGLYYRWSDGGVEATSMALRALLAVSPENTLIGPVTNWLIKNRRGSHWSNTRDTAISLLALNDYLLISGELNADQGYKLIVNGNFLDETKIKNVLKAPSNYLVPNNYIVDGVNEIHLVRTSGKGPLYFSVQSQFFSLEEPITPAGNELFVRRQYQKQVGRPTLLKGFVYDSVPLNDGDTINSGERIETVITIESKNNYEYLIFEDLKPAGFEAVQIKSGTPFYTKELKSAAVKVKLGNTGKSNSVNRGTGSKRSRIAKEAFSPPRPQNSSNTDYTGRSRWVHQELRDRKVVFFIDKLPQGFWEIRYTLRAEVPGKFHALPVMAHAMYIPEIRTNGSEIRVTVKDKKE